MPAGHAGEKIERAAEHDEVVALAHAGIEEITVAKRHLGIFLRRVIDHFLDDFGAQ